MTQHDPKRRGTRLQTYLRDAGVASRRGAEALIRKGKVKINGKIVTEMGTMVHPQDKVTAHGKAVSSKQPDSLVIMMNKPPGFTVTSRRFKDEQNVYALLPKTITGAKGSNLFPVGRLDKNSSGLLLMTNDGQLANHLMHPRYEHEKEYVVTVTKPVSRAHLQQLKHGVTDEGERLVAASVRKTGINRLNIILTQGRKRHIRRMLEGVGLRTASLQRIRIGTLPLGNLARGKWRVLGDHEVKRLA